MQDYKQYKTQGARTYKHVKINATDVRLQLRYYFNF